MKTIKSGSTLAAMQRMELYFMAHPGSPSAVRRPRLSLRGKMWRALLGSSHKNGITGFGSSVEAALRDFDTQYLRALRPPEDFNETQYIEPRATVWQGRRDSVISSANPFRADFLMQ